MNPAAVAKILAEMGVTGIDPTKVSAAMLLAEELGGEIQVDKEGVESYFPDVEESFYMPKAPKNWYYDAEGLRQAGRLGNMRGLTSVSSGVFRRLLGIR